MNKVFLITNIIFFLFISNCFPQDKDHFFDPKTSAMVPKFLGQVKAMKGKVYADERELGVGSKVYPNEVFKTG